MGATNSLATKESKLSEHFVSLEYAKKNVVEKNKMRCMHYTSALMLTIFGMQHVFSITWGSSSQPNLMISIDHVEAYA
jgi:hypothetical protein